MSSVKLTRLAVLRDQCAFDLPADKSVHHGSCRHSKSYDYQGNLACMQNYAGVAIE